MAVDRAQRPECNWQPSAAAATRYFGLAGGSAWGLMIGSLAGRLGKLGVPGGGGGGVHLPCTIVPCTIVPGTQSGAATSDGAQRPPPRRAASMD